MHGSTVETGNSALYDALAALTPNANRRLAGRGAGAGPTLRLSNRNRGQLRSWRGVARTLVALYVAVNRIGA